MPPLECRISIFCGAISQQEVNAELANAHVLVNTSLYEGFPNTFIQAWMRRTVVVSLNVNPDGIFDETAGRVSCWNVRSALTGNCKTIDYGPCHCEKKSLNGRMRMHLNVTP